MRIARRIPDILCTSPLPCESARDAALAIQREETTDRIVYDNTMLKAICVSRLPTAHIARTALSRGLKCGKSLDFPAVTYTHGVNRLILGVGAAGRQARIRSCERARAATMLSKVTRFGRTGELPLHPC